MEDGASHQGSAGTPPPPPEPSYADPAGKLGVATTNVEGSDEAPRLENEDWDINSVSALGALRMLIAALEALADAIGDVPPTPPVSRPGTPKKLAAEARRRSSPDAGDCGMRIGSPEAHPHEPLTIEHGAGAEHPEVQRNAIARRFFSKTAPPFSVAEYLKRLHHYCPHSSAVYLTAATYIHRLCVVDGLVPATNRTIHRLVLSAIRIASKGLEDHKWAQERFAGVGGVSRTQLMNLEIALCFLLDFELGVHDYDLARRMYLLQQAGRQGAGTRNRLSGNFKLKVPLGKKTNVVEAAA
ncbi:cyclin-domain-containing protein [Teratosphaeria nubilosa]|uniref:Cyclin-domain-containing protein n=1 Tax=Teratosphaeria nubilosa TaxID=161662 RepID=A0A6G1LP47_9PEZI|nr:cyclin-domain-containing protein [Teratosphaeria nubilosa]